MSCYIVIFELKAPAVSRPRIAEALKAFGTFCPLTPNAWCVVSASKTATVIRDELKTALGPGDQLYVMRSGTEGAWSNSYGEKNNEWLKKNL